MAAFLPKNILVQNRVENELHTVAHVCAAFSIGMKNKWKKKIPKKISYTIEACLSNYSKNNFFSHSNQIEKVVVCW